jgi:hypothetical protein
MAGFGLGGDAAALPFLHDIADMLAQVLVQRTSNHRMAV